MTRMTLRDHDDAATLRARLADAEALVHAIQHGEIDALVVQTPRGQAVYTLTGADRPYRAFLDAMRDGAITVDDAGTVLYANRAFARLVGAPLEAVLGTPVRRYLDWPEAQESGAPATRHGDLRTAGGQGLPVHVSATALEVDGRTLVTGVIRDLSDERLTERLRVSEERLRAAADATGFGVYDFDPRSGDLVWSGQLRRLFGVPDDRRASVALLLRRVHRDDRARIREVLRRAGRATAAERYDLEFRVVLPGGELRWLHETAHLFVDDAGGQPRLSRILGTVRDVTGRRRADEALRSSEQRQSFLLTLSDALRPLADPAEIQERACRLLADVLDVARACYVEIDETTAVGRIERDVVRDDAASLAGEHRLADLGWSVAILRRGECHVSPDPQGQGFAPPAEAGRDIGASCAAPIIRAGRLVGALAVTDPRPRAWSEPQVALVREVGERVWAAIDAARAQEALRARHRQLDVLARTSHRLLTAADVDTAVMQAIGADVAALIGMESFFHFRPADQPGRLRLAAYGGVTEDEQRRFAAMPVGELLCGRVAETRQRLIIEDRQLAAPPARDMLREAGFTSYAGFPLVAGGVLYGTLAFVSRRPHRFRVGDEQTIQAVCDQIGIALERRRSELDRRVSEERAHLAIEGGELGSWDVDLASGRATWNRRHAEMQGYDADIPHTVEGWRTLVHPDDLHEVIAAMTRARVARTAFAVEHRLRRADTGEERWLALYGRYSYDDRGEPVRVSGVSRDVTERRRSEEAQQQFVRLADEAADFIGMATPAGQAVYVNPAGRALVGLEAADVQSAHVLDLIPEAEREWFAATVLRQALATGAWEGETRLRHFQTGASIDVLQKVFTIRDPKTLAPVRIATTAVDIRARKRAMADLVASETRFRQMADQTPVIMWVTDAQGSIEFVNQAYCEFFGVTLEQVRGPHWEPLLHPDDGAYVTAFREALLAGQPFQASARVRRADGEWRWIASVGHPRVADDGRLVGMIGVSPDVTEQRRASEREREAARQKDEFIAVLAHELRNPLAPIRTSIGVLRAPGTTEPTRNHCRNVIDRQVSHMARLLDDLLDVSRLSRGTLTLQRTPVRLRDVVAHASETVRPVVDERGHTLVIEPIDPAIVLDADPARLAQVLTNLLNNAAKYTNHGGTVTLTAEPREGQVVIAVRDTGIGLRPEMRERIFELFAQVEDARHRADGGLGIGLGLTRRLVEMHGGSIDVESDGPGHGATFTVTLPLEASARLDDEHGQPQAAAADGAAARRRVLVVDDNVDAADMLAALLDTMACETRTAYDGHAALREAASFHPDLVLLDLGLPGLDGGAVCARLRQETWGAAVVIAAVTGWGQEEDRRRTKISGFDAHLVKPVDPERLIALVRDLPMPRLM